MIVARPERAGYQLDFKTLVSAHVDRKRINFGLRYVRPTVPAAFPFKHIPLRSIFP